MATKTRKKKKPYGVIAKDQRTGRVNQVEFSAIGDFIWNVRLDTPSEEREMASMSRRELADVINANLDEGEYEIGIGTIANIERGVNLHLGYWDRIIQLSKALEITITMKSKVRSLAVVR